MRCSFILLLLPILAYGRPGEFCDESNGINCNNPWEECDNEFQCVCKKSYYTDLENNECVAYVGKQCYAGEELLLNCVKNAFCHVNSPNEDEGICLCSSNYKEGFEGQCYLEFDRPCHYQETQEQCNSKEFLQCSQTTNKCICEKGFHYESNEEAPNFGKCLGEFQMQCPLNYYKNDSNFDRRVDCVNGGYCSFDSNSCACLSSGSNTIDKLCYKTYLDLCKVEGFPYEICNPSTFLNCANEQCHCAEGFLVNSPFDDRGRCIGKSGTKCRYEEGYVANCTDLAQCSYNELNEATCQCEQNSHSFTDGKCYKNYDAPCVSLTGDECNKFKYVSCREKEDQTRRCACNRSFKYDEPNELCRRLVNEECTYYGEHYMNVTCIANAHCAAKRCVCDEGFGYFQRDEACYGLLGKDCSQVDCLTTEHLTCDGTKEVCICKPGFSEDSKKPGKCFADFGNECNFWDTHCNEEKFLKCLYDANLDQFCGCTLEDSYYSEEMGYCVKKAGFDCKNGNYTAICTENAFCNPISEKCHCLFEYHDDGNGYCVRNEKIEY